MDSGSINSEHFISFLVHSSSHKCKHKRVKKAEKDLHAALNEYKNHKSLKSKFLHDLKDAVAEAEVPTSDIYIV